MILRARESIDLSQDDWQSLERISDDLACPSWRTLLRLIARGQLRVMRPTAQTDHPPATRRQPERVMPFPERPHAPTARGRHVVGETHVERDPDAQD